MCFHGIAIKHFVSTIALKKTGTAFGISVGLGTAGGFASYFAETEIRNDVEWDWRNFAIAGISGGAQAAVTFGLAFGAGYLGLFNKPLTGMMSRVRIPIPLPNGTQQIILSAQANIFTRSLFYSLPAAGARFVTDWFINLFSR